MECKFGSPAPKCSIRLELIDTLWNVNLPEHAKKADVTAELIDTLWNVNRALISYYCIC